MVRQGGISGRLVRSPEYVFDLGTTVARGWKIFPFGGLLYQRLCWSGQTPGNGCRTTSSGSIPTIFVAGKHPGTAECRQRGVFTGKTEWIRQEDLPFDFAQRLATPLSKLADHDEQLRELSHQLFVAALKQCHGNRSRAAVLLGLTRNKFYRLLKLHGLDGESSRNGPGESDWIQ